jgi:hypothetical protein
MKHIHPLRRLLSLPAGAAFTLLALGVSASPAVASLSEVPGSGGAGVVPVPLGRVRIVTESGITGWQVALIALIAALMAAVAAVAIDRAQAGRRRPPTPAT